MLMEQAKFIVVMNHEEQYSIWDKDRELPLGWNRIDIPDGWLESYSLQNEGADRFDKETCLGYIEATWADIRPLSVRKALQDHA